jgi:hypothetical protein
MHEQVGRFNEKLNKTFDKVIHSAALRKEVGDRDF